MTEAQEKFDREFAELLLSHAEQATSLADVPSVVHAMIRAAVVFAVRYFPRDEVALALRKVADGLAKGPSEADGETHH